MSSDTPLLELVDVLRRADDGTTLIDGISLSIAEGSRTAILGPPGAGKTLLLRTMALLDPLTAGEVRFRGQTIAAGDVPGLRRSVVYVHQRPVLMEGTVHENIRLPFQFRANRERHFDEVILSESLHGLNLRESFADRSVSDLSGGEQQIVALLRALQVSPTALLLDEPTSSLDEAGTRSVESLLTHWLNFHPRRAVVLVTHRADQAGRLTDRQLTIRAGRLEGKQ